MDRRCCELPIDRKSEGAGGIALEETMRSEGRANACGLTKSASCDVGNELHSCGKGRASAPQRPNRNRAEVSSWNLYCGT